MRKQLKYILAFVFLFTLIMPPNSRVAAQEGILNDSTTGTTLNELVKLTGVSTAIITSAGDTSGAIGLCGAGCGTTGSPILQVVGFGNCVFDGATTANDYVTQSTTVNGECKDFGPTLPGNPPQVVGRVLFTHTSAGLYIIKLQIN